MADVFDSLDIFDEVERQATPAKIEREAPKTLRRSIKEEALEIPRFAAETGAFLGSALGYGLKSAANVVRGGAEAIRKGDIGAGLKTYEEGMSNFQPLESPLAPSRTGQALSSLVEPASKYVSEKSGDPELGQKLMYLTALSGVKGSKVAKTPLTEAAIRTYDTLSPTTSGPRVGKATTTLEGVKQSVYNKRTPQVLDNIFQTSAAKLSKPKKKAVSEEVRQQDAAKTTGFIDEMLQQAEEGRLGERQPDGTRVPIDLDQGGVATGIEAVRNAKRNLWDEEIGPVLANAERAGTLIDTNPIADFYAKQAESLKGSKFSNAYKEAVRMEQHYRGKQMTPSEAQAEIARFNQKLNYDQLPSEQKTVTTMEMKEAAMLRHLTDEAIETGLDTLGFQDLKGRYGALTHGENMLAEAVFNELKKQNHGAWSNLDTIASGELIIGAAKMNPALIKAALVTEGLSYLKKRAKSPDVAFQRMLRARRAKGIERREVYTQPEPQTMPQNMTTFDPSTGQQIPARGQGVETGGLPPFTEGPQPVQGIPTKGLPPFTEGPQPVQGIPTKGLPPFTEGPQPAPAMEGVNSLGVQPPVAEPPTMQNVNSMGQTPPVKPQAFPGNMGLDLKQAVKDSGGGKKGVAAVALQLGVPAGVLSMWLLADDKKRKELAMLPAFAGLVAWKIPQQKVSSASTSISYPNVAAKSPIIFKAFKEGKIEIGPKNADIGGGRYDQITDYLKTQGVENMVYDPFNRTAEHNTTIRAKLEGGGADTATVSNVLNVIPDKESRLQTIATAHDSVRPGGKVYFSMYEAPKAGEVKGRDAYQTGMKPRDYIPEIEEIFGRGNVTQKGLLIIATKE